MYYAWRMPTSMKNCFCRASVCLHPLSNLRFFSKLELTIFSVDNIYVSSHILKHAYLLNPAALEKQRVLWMSPQCVLIKEREWTQIMRKTVAVLLQLIFFFAATIVPPLLLLLLCFSLACWEHNILNLHIYGPVSGFSNFSQNFPLLLASRLCVYVTDFASLFVAKA